MTHTKKPSSEPSISHVIKKNRCWGMIFLYKFSQRCLGLLVATRHSAKVGSVVRSFHGMLPLQFLSCPLSFHLCLGPITSPSLKVLSKKCHTLQETLRPECGRKMYSQIEKYFCKSIYHFFNSL